MRIWIIRFWLVYIDKGVNVRYVKQRKGINAQSKHLEVLNTEDLTTATIKLKKARLACLTEIKLIKMEKV